jgi:hypothetical protein
MCMKSLERSPGAPCTIQCVNHYCILGFLESGLFHVLLSKNQFPGSREFPGNAIFIPAFPELAK